jgi:hypothetical protein
MRIPLRRNALQQLEWGADALPVLALFGHPGHELLIGQLLADSRATVTWLSDGSGGAQSARSQYTRMFLEECDCTVGPVNGFASDRRFYEAIMAGDIGFLDPICASLENAMLQLKPAAILTDPMEYFNPLHDLANTLADILITNAAKRGQKISKLVYANEYPELYEADEAAITRVLTSGEQFAQRRRLEAYTPLHAEWKRMEADGKLASMHIEKLFPDPVRLGSIPPARETRFKSAFYEDYGRAAVKKGTYKSCLTFADHALPYARRLVENHIGSGV